MFKIGDIVCYSQNTIEGSFWAAEKITKIYSSKDDKSIYYFLNYRTEPFKNNQIFLVKQCSTCGRYLPLKYFNSLPLDCDFCFEIKNK